MLLQLAVLALLLAAAVNAAVEAPAPSGESYDPWQLTHTYYIVQCSVFAVASFVIFMQLVLIGIKYTNLQCRRSSGLPQRPARGAAARQGITQQ
jgi:hypothetical protein